MCALVCVCVCVCACVRACAYVCVRARACLCVAVGVRARRRSAHLKGNTDAAPRLPLCHAPTLAKHEPMCHGNFLSLCHRALCLSPPALSPSLITFFSAPVSSPPAFLSLSLSFFHTRTRAHSFFSFRISPFTLNKQTKRETEREIESAQSPLSSSSTHKMSFTLPSSSLSLSAPLSVSLSVPFFFSALLDRPAFFDFLAPKEREKERGTHIAQTCTHKEI